MLRQFSGIMFDMDNTLLASNIDFRWMKGECLRILTSARVKGFEQIDDGWTAAEMIALAKRENEADVVNEMLEIVEEIEREGMEGATLEHGAYEVVQELSEQKKLLIVTNNSTAAATFALERLKIATYFTDIYGRDKMDALKPERDSLLSVLQKHRSIPKQRWVMIGDSWIDGRAAQRANVRYICYNGSKETHREKQIPIFRYITSLEQLIQ